MILVYHPASKEAYLFKEENYHNRSRRNLVNRMETIDTISICSWANIELDVNPQWGTFRLYSVSDEKGEGGGTWMRGSLNKVTIIYELKPQ